MAKRYDVCSPCAKKDGGTYWHRIGIAFESDKGISIEFNSLPLPDKEGRVRVLLFEPRENQGRELADGGKPAGGPVAPRRSADMDDEILFAPEFR